MPREIENNVYAKLWGTNKVHYRRSASGVLLVFSITPSKIDQNINQNHSTDKVQILGNERR